MPRRGMGSGRTVEGATGQETRATPGDGKRDGNCFTKITKGSGTGLLTRAGCMTIQFQSYDPRSPTRLYRRTLPHLRQDGATYFVTFRLSDSIPDFMQKDLEQIERLMSREDQCATALVEADRQYFKAMKRFLDLGHGSCCLREPEICQVVQSSLNAFDGKRYELGEYAIMPNHVHAVVRPIAGVELEEILRGWKGFTARRINRMLGREGSVWQEESYDRLVRDSLELERIGRYIRNNGKPFEEREPG